MKFESILLRFGMWRLNFDGLVKRLSCSMSSVEQTITLNFLYVVNDDFAHYIFNHITIFWVFFSLESAIVIERFFFLRT